MHTPDNIFELIADLKKTNTPSTQYKNIINSFLEMKARREGIPLHGVLELTPLCNLDCKMCYVHLNETEFNPRALLSVETWKDIVNQARELGLLRVTLTGGECLTYPFFDELYLHLYERGIRIGLLSNGLLMDAERIRFLKRYRPSSINISLYGSNEEEYYSVTGHRVYKRIYDNICLLRDEELPVSLTITPNEFMGEHFRELLETAESLAVPFHINSALMKPRHNTGREKHDLSDEQYIKLYRVLNELRHNELTPVDSIDIPDAFWDNSHQIDRGTRCGAGRSSFTIQYDGSMTPCAGLYEQVTKPLVVGFKNAWKSLNEVANNYIMPIDCVKCIYRTQCLVCPAMHKEAPVGHCDTRICDRTKKMVKAGLLSIPHIKE